MKQKKLTIVTTVPLTIKGILKGQPHFLSKHFDVSVISSPDSELCDVQQYEGVNCHQVAMQRGISPIKDIISVFRMVKTLSIIRPDIIHSYTPKAGLISMLAGFICRVPVRIHTFTGLLFPTSTGLKRLLLTLIDRLICACATHVVPEGEGVKHDLIDCSITKKPLNVIGNGNIAGVDTNTFHKQSVIDSECHHLLQHQFVLPTDSFVFCFVGRLTKDKGIDELIGAFSQLPEHAHLLVVGDIDRRVPIDDDTVSLLQNHPRIHLTGWLDDVRPALSLSHVLVLPSYREGFPNTPIQSGAMELPCIVTDINGCNEIIEHGRNGWIVPVKDELALYEAMLTATGAENLEQMGKYARKQIEQKFERSAHWQRMLCFYRKIAGNDDKKTI